MLCGHAPAVELHPFQLEPRALLQRRAQAQFDRAANAGDALPGQGIATLPQQTRHQSVMERIARR